MDSLYTIEVLKAFRAQQVDWLFIHLFVVIFFIIAIVVVAIYRR